MKIVLAPMQGYADRLMRDMLTSIGGYDLVVAEFVRVTESLIPAKVWRRMVPELGEGGTTPSGTPLIPQILGNDGPVIARNLGVLKDMGVERVDINFGCPSPTVNKHKAGAWLLLEPQKIAELLNFLIKEAPEGMLISAKVRLGWEDPAESREIIAAINDTGICELTVHARTKLDAYEHPARWEWFHEILQNCRHPVVANGDILTVADGLRFLEEFEVEGLMLGRGVLGDPWLAKNLSLAIKSGGKDGLGKTDLPTILHFAIDFVKRATEEIGKPAYPGSRLKQLLRHMERNHPEAGEIHEKILRMKDAREILDVLENYPR